MKHGEEKNFGDLHGFLGVGFCGYVDRNYSWFFSDNRRIYY